MIVFNDSMSSCCRGREGAGRPRASLRCALVDVIKENLPACQGEIQGFVFTQNKRRHSMGGRRNLSMDGMYAAQQGKIRVGSIQCCMHAGVPAIEGA